MTTAEKPLLRGVSHQIFFFVALLGGAFLVYSAPPGRATVGALVYVTSLVLLLGISASYHRITWQPGPRLWMRRLDHSAIFVLIAGTYTPVCMSLPGGGALALSLFWIAAVLGTLKSMIWPRGPKWVIASLCVAMGWGGVTLMPTIHTLTGDSGLAMILSGGLFYSAGAVIYALKRPNPWPGVFGYHEVFHALVIVAAGLHFAVITELVGVTARP